MAGIGDLLAACRDVGSQPVTAAAIDIDPRVAARCEQNAAFSQGQLKVVTGSAFTPNTWATLPATWDLVITNPPYVRYQAGGTYDDGLGFRIPGAAQIRRGLIECIVSSALPDAERMDFERCATAYSGLADLAVPSWLLCACRVAVGGTLALVVPSTWLTRDYAAPVLYVLRKYFETKYVVVDLDRAWFDDALVQTTLVVARRVPAKANAIGSGRHLRVGIRDRVADERSVVGRWFPESATPELDFVQLLAGFAEGRGGRLPGLEVSWSDESDQISELRRSSRRHVWLGTGPEELVRSVPEVIRRVLDADPPALMSLEIAGWRVGQGLRTGANDFFYVSRPQSAATFVSPVLPGQALVLPEELLRPAIRRQADLPSEGRVVAGASSFVLLLGAVALPEDIATSLGPKPWRPMTDDLARLTRTAAVQAVGDPPGAPLSELSAVRTNARPGRESPSRSAHFWYQLPPLASRHTPLLLLPRVNSAQPRPFHNPDGRLVVDANFSTFWPTRADALPTLALLAILSSSWTLAFLESIGTVLGGGALKVEATHVRRLLLPIPQPSAVHHLEKLGSALGAGKSPHDVLAEIDSLVFEIIGEAHSRQRIVAIADQARLRRTR
jgi:hypothetical protein